MRATCRRCLRPEGHCACGDLPEIAARTHVLILQHPREARLAICSAWLTRIALRNADLRRGVRFDGDERVRAALATPGSALLFPGEEAAPVESRAGDPPPVLVVIDGTWHQAERMLRDTPGLAALPRLRAEPARPSGYGDLRREPADGHLSTVEAVALALGALERDPARFEPMIRAFQRSVERQLACARGERRNPRHRPGWRDTSRRGWRGPEPA